MFWNFGQSTESENKIHGLHFLNKLTIDAEQINYLHDYENNGFHRNVGHFHLEDNL
jgi:hypothetical protein